MTALDRRLTLDEQLASRLSRQETSASASFARLDGRAAVGTRPSSGVAVLPLSSVTNATADPEACHTCPRPRVSRSRGPRAAEAGATAAVATATASPVPVHEFMSSEHLSRWTSDSPGCRCGVQLVGWTGDDRKDGARTHRQRQHGMLLGSC